MLMKYQAIVLASMAVSIVQGANEDIPDPPACIFDCALFDVVSTGEVDDCATTQSWTDDMCLEDCSSADIIVLEELEEIFCSYVDDDGSVGSYGSYEGYHPWDVEDEEVVPTPSPTYVPTVSPTSPDGSPTPTVSPTSSEVVSTSSPTAGTGTPETAVPTAVPTETPEPVVITIGMTLAFAEELSSEQIDTVQGSIVQDVVASNDFPEDWVACVMELNTGGTTRHILSIVYDTSIIITIPAAALVTDDGEENEDLVASTESFVSAEGLDTLVESITALPVLVEANGGEAPTAVVVDVDVTDPGAPITMSPTPTPTPMTTGSATRVSSAFGLLVSVVCVAIVL